MQQEIFLARILILFIWNHLYFHLLQCNHTHLFTQIMLECHAYFCIPSICISNHRYVRYRELSLHQKTQWYLLVGPTVLLKPLALFLPSYLTAQYVFQKNWALSCFDCGGESQFSLLQSQLFFYFWSWLLINGQKKKKLQKQQRILFLLTNFSTWTWLCRHLCTTENTSAWPFPILERK